MRESGLWWISADPYHDLKAFGAGDVVTMDNATKAIAAYERTLITPNSAYDLYAKGDLKALSEQQARGLATFAEAGCTSCHQGPTFSGPQMPPGTGFFMKFPTFPDSPYVAKYDFLSDTGRGADSKNDADKNVWRVPGLRNLVYTAPYFHNCQVHTIDEAVRIMGSTQLNKELSDAQVADIVAFLEALTGPFPFYPNLSSCTYKLNSRHDAQADEVGKAAQCIGDDGPAAHTPLTEPLRR